MSVFQMIASASAPLVVLASLLTPLAPAQQDTKPMSAVEVERLLVTCGNKQGDLRHPETAFCVSYFSSRQRRPMTSGMCSDCVASCDETSYAACKKRCARACDLGMLQKS